MNQSDHWVKYTRLQDFGPMPIVLDIESATEENNYFRNSLWTGQNSQLVLMSINVGDDIGLEVHPNVDQYIRIEDGKGRVMMGETKDNLDFQIDVGDNFLVIVPAGTWHNIKNTDNKPLKLYTIYTPPEHPKGTIHPTKADAMADENHN